MNLAGKVALVTGSGRGLGLAVAETLAAAGASVMLHDLTDPAEGEAIAAAMSGRSGSAVAYTKADFATADGVAGLIETTQSRLGVVDILVNNAVVRHFAPVEHFPVARWELALAVNISAPFHAIRLAIPSMRAKGWGRIINMASIYSVRGVVNRVDYVTTKTAMIGLTRAVALEVAGAGITCNAICPGTLPTPDILARIEGIAKDQGISVESATRQYLEARLPGGEFIAMETVAALVAFLCNDGSKDINGATLPVDAGMSAT